MAEVSDIIFCGLEGVETLKDKIELATILGTLQASLTDFRYLRKIWKKNTEEEALLGVSLTGVMDHATFGKMALKKPQVLKDILTELKNHSIEVNKHWAAELGVNQATAITTQKPSGTVSQLVNCSSGIHARYSDYYIRTVRNSANDPLTKFLIDQGVPNEPAEFDPGTVIFSFPIKSPKNSVKVGHFNAVEQLKIWKLYQDNYTEHKPSCTVYYKEEEFLGIGDWIYRNFDSISGVSFMPQTDHVYNQAPYQDIYEVEYNKAVRDFPVIDWDAFEAYENEDNTTGAQTMACTGDKCEIV